MSDSSRTLGRRDALRGCAGLAATVAVAAHPTAAQTGNETDTSDNETASNGTADNGTETLGNETADNETTEPTDTEETDAGNETAETEGSNGGSGGVAGSLSTEGIMAVFLGILGAALLSPLLFALVLKYVYDDGLPDEPANEYRPK